MSLPPLADIPPATIRLGIAPEEWQACLESWLALSDLYLRLPSKEFSSVSTSQSSIPDFLASFYHERSNSQPGDDSFNSQAASRLQRSCFLLTHRILLNQGTPDRLLQFGFLAEFCHVHARNASLGRLMGEAWKRGNGTLQKSMESAKKDMLKSLESSTEDSLQRELRHIADLMRASADIATLFMTGSDFLDGLISQYDGSKNSSEARKLVVATAYLGLLALVKTDPPNVSLLTDHLYSLKSQADQSRGVPTLLADLATNTSLVPKLKRTTNAGRLSKLLDTLQTYHTSSIAQPKKQPRRKQSKGKGKAPQVDGEMHMHRMSLVTQVQDLFPDLGSGFVLKLFDEYGDDVEQVTAHLLDDSLPEHLRNLDRTEQASQFNPSKQEEIEHLAPKSTPPLQSYIPERHNVFDDDELDELELNTSKLHIGKKDRVQTDSTHPNKSAILSALAAFDSDDDERDDTYDVEDVGGTIDTTNNPDGEPTKSTPEETDSALFAAYKSNPELFGRTFNIRRGQPRQALKAETGMTDEAIEGWAIMLQRDPKRLSRLEAQFSSFDGKQTELGRSAYRESETEDSDVPADRGGFRGRGRGRGRGGRGRGGGSVAGPSGDPGTANAQRRKEASKGSRANHNRRDQRAKKMARGGFSG